MKSDSQKIMENISLISFIISIALLIVYKLNFNKILFNLFIFFATFCYHFGIRVLNGIITPKFKNSLNYNSFHFRNKKFENKIYEKLNVRKWKDLMPTYNIDEFSLEKYSLDEIAINMCNAELVHEINAILAFVPIIISIIFKLNYIWLIVFIFSSILTAMLDGIFVCIQRYNRPRVVKIIKKKQNAKQVA